MPFDIRGRRVAIIGGDRRESVVADILAGLGAQVRAVGLMWPDEATAVANGLPETFAWADIVILPVAGTDEVGRILSWEAAWPDEPARLTDDILGRARPGAVLLIGRAHPSLWERAHRHGIRLYEFRERDDFAVLNSVPSAEGAIQLAMERTAITLHGSASLVLGYGRTGQTLARMLRGIGAFTTVAARRPEVMARIMECGYRPIPFRDLREEIRHQEVIFNTVPAPVLREDVLSAVQPSAVIIDLATAPGGTDFVAAKRLGLQAVLAPGLPGIVAPRSAGRIMAEVILNLLAEIEGGEGVGTLG